MDKKLSQKSIKDAIVGYMNPYHIKYIKENPFNTLERLFNALDKIERSSLKDILGIAYMYYESNSLIGGKGDFDNIEVMKRKLYNKSIDIANLTSEHTAVNAFTSIILNGFVSLGNPLTINEKKLSLQRQMESMKYNKDGIKEKVKEQMKIKSTDEDMENDYQGALQFMGNSLTNIKENQERHYQRYNDFCNIVIKDLLKEEIRPIWF